jgi:predicted aminopeptidase
MPLDYSTLTDRAMCDKASEEIDFELLTFSAHDVNDNLADKRTERTQSSTTSQLAVVEAKIASKQAILAATGIDDDTRENTQTELDTLLIQRRKLQKRGRQASGYKEFLADVDAEQNAAQVALLTSIKAGIAQHRATLPG